MMIDDFDPVIVFTAEDRCDGCGAQAYSLAQREDMTDLLFCIHHRKANSDSLLDEGWKIVDDYEALSRIVGPEVAASL